MFDTKIRQKTVRAKHASQIDLLPSKFGSDGRENSPSNSPSIFPLFNKLAFGRKVGEKVSVENGSENAVNDFTLNDSTKANDRAKLYKRARAKYFTNSLAVGLANLDSPLKKRYWNTYHCCHALEACNGKVTGKYCKNRWCMICNRIRTAQLMIQYLPTIRNWGDDVWFVTLTIVNPVPEKLAEAINEMESTFKRISETLRKRGSPLVCIRKTECTKQPNRDDYHPHFHVIVKGKTNAIELRKQWIQRNATCNHTYQDIKHANDNSVKELFKYFTKIISGKRQTGERKIVLSDLDWIFRSMMGRQVFQSFGFKCGAPPTGDDSRAEIEALEYAESAVFEWMDDLRDWVDIHTGEKLTNYKASEAFENLMESIK